jgi:hypothetical protein
VGPRAVLDVVVRRKIPSPRRESNPRTPIVQPVVQRYTIAIKIYERVHMKGIFVFEVSGFVTRFRLPI